MPAIHPTTKAADVLQIIETMKEVGLREFQDSIHYAIFIIAVLDDNGEQTNRQTTVSHLFTLREMADKLRQIELLIEQQSSDQVSTLISS